jgi:hypothetical protein
MQLLPFKERVKRRLRSMLNVDTVSEEDAAPGSVVIDGMGHRAYVGTLWDTMGSLQFRFMIEQGLKPSDVFLDVACGSLRGGVRFIPYLETGNYLGIDIKRELIEVGIEKELGEALYELKKPEFVVSDVFEFDRFSKQPDFALAQSLFTHLLERDILLCMKNLRAKAKSNTKFFATFFECDQPARNNPSHSHPYLNFAYTRQQMASFGEISGWAPHYIGNWNHPRGQKMFEYSPK